MWVRASRYNVLNSRRNAREVVWYEQSTFLMDVQANPGLGFRVEGFLGFGVPYFNTFFLKEPL